MKFYKLFLVFLGMFLVGLTTNANVSAHDDNQISFINSNGVEITKLGYNKLTSLGYVDREIDILEIEEYNKIMNMNIKYTTKDSYILKNEDNIQDDFSPTNPNSTCKPNSILDGKPNPGFGREDGIEPGGSDENNKFSTVEENSRQIEVIGSYVEQTGSLGTFFVKVNVTYLETPRDRYSDTVGINFSNNVQVLSETIEGIQKPKFSSKFLYDEDYFYDDQVGNQNTTITHRVIEKNNFNNSEYTYKANEGINVNFNLPKDLTIIDQVTHNPFYSYTYTNFFYTFSSEFIPRQSGINACSFGGFLIHQTNTGTFDWGSISLTPSKPFISYTLPEKNSEPTYDKVVGCEIFFENLI